jgi:cytochrome c5
MEKPSFSHSVYTFVGISGFIILFAIIVAHNPVTTLPERSGKIHKTPVQSVMTATGRDSSGVNPDIDPAILNQGKSLYQTFCAACHGMPGVQRSPLLAGSDVFDDVSVYGTDAGTIKRLIEDGIIEVGMVPWKSVLTGDQVDSIVAYILSQRYPAASGNG